MLKFFAHIHDLDAELRIVQRALHFLHGDFRRDSIVNWRRFDAAENFVINQFLDRRMIAANGTRRVAAQFQFAELHGRAR